MPGDNFKGITSSHQSGFNQLGIHFFIKLELWLIISSSLPFLVKNFYKDAVIYN